jgi:hypothetical protein
MEAFAHLLALQEHRFTRWHELPAKRQDEYRERVQILLALGAEYDPEIAAFVARQ